MRRVWQTRFKLSLLSQVRGDVVLACVQTAEGRRQETHMREAMLSTLAVVCLRVRLRDAEALRFAVYEVRGRARGSGLPSPWTRFVRGRGRLICTRSYGTFILYICFFARHTTSSYMLHRFRTLTSSCHVLPIQCFAIELLEGRLYTLYHSHCHSMQFFLSLLIYCH